MILDYLFLATARTLTATACSAWCYPTAAAVIWVFEITQRGYYLVCVAVTALWTRWITVHLGVGEDVKNITAFPATVLIYWHNHLSNNFTKICQGHIDAVAQV